MNFYKLLAIKISASEDEIKKAYRKIAKRFHPDLNPSGDFIFKFLNEAYTTLLDPQKRKEYDRCLIGKDNGKFSNFLFFTHKPKDGSDINLSIYLENKENEKEIVVGYKRYKVCEFCEGNGLKEDSKIEICKKCNGTGKVKTKLGSIVCFSCFGEGYKILNPCKFCKGLGYHYGKEKIRIKVKDLKSGDKVLLKGFGNCGINGGIDGNLIIHIR